MKFRTSMVVAAAVAAVGGMASGVMAQTITFTAPTALAVDTVTTQATTYAAPFILTLTGLSLVITGLAVAIRKVKGGIWKITR